jgi:general secretion pathway protein G
MMHMKTCSKSKAGFSLIEILVVIMIISVLATVVVLNLLDAPDQGKKAATAASIKSLEVAVSSYNIANGLPTQAQGLNALINAPTIAPIPKNYPQGGYLSSTELPLDGWKRPFIYLTPARDGKTRYEIISYGADGEPGGEGYDADMSSAQPSTMAIN